MNRIVMTSPDHYEVCYAINPWMRPDAWSRDPSGLQREAKAGWAALADRLRSIGLTVEVAPGQPGLPDMVFPANAAIVLDRKVLLARFRHPERRGEEAPFRDFFQGLQARGLVRSVDQLPPGVFQEGAGDCIWDDARQLFWAGFGPRSSAESLDCIQQWSGRRVVGLELVTGHFYHLDTCFCALAGGEVMYYPDALSAEGRRLVERLVPAELRIPATLEEASAFSLNAVGFDRHLVMAPPPPRLRGLLEQQGYRCLPVDLRNFMLSGGGAYCMTLRLDLTSRAMRCAAAQ